MIPDVGADSVKITRYGAQVSGRIFGIAAMPILVPDAARRDSTS